MTKSTPLDRVISNKIGNRVRKKVPVVVPIGFGLRSEKEEAFCLLIADGVPLIMAFKTAGISTVKANASSSALALYRRPEIQARIAEIIKARATHPPITLPEVTDMLKRVYVGAIHSNEYTPAHNAAFSLARLHGLVVDLAQLDVIRRPSREPDAPAEIALSDWIAKLPSPTHTTVISEPLQREPLTIEGSAFGSDLDGPATGVVFENEAPLPPVTGTHSPGAYSGEVSDERGPILDEGTSLPAGLPSAEDLL